MIPKIITEEKIQEFKMYLYEEERSENTIKNMLELVPTISEMSEKKIKEKDLWQL